MRVKICGITSLSDARLAAQAGADAIGLNFVGGPRQIDVDQAAAILQELPPFLTPVALVRLELGRVPDPLIELLGQYWVSHVQVYGEISSGSLALLANDGFQGIPVVSVRDEGFAGPVSDWLSKIAGRLPAAIVLDAYDPERLGGTGKPFQWDWVARAAESGAMENWPPIMLAGGLTPDNVAEAILKVHPYAVDVSSGVEEDGKPGVKSAMKVRQFIQNARGQIAL